MKLTDEKILELAEQHGNEYGDWEFSTDSLMSFARAILKEAGAEELERDAERYRFLEHQCATGTYRGIISRAAIDAAIDAAKEEK